MSTSTQLLLIYTNIIQRAYLRQKNYKTETYDGHVIGSNVLEANECRIYGFSLDYCAMLTND